MLRFHFSRALFAPFVTIILSRSFATPPRYHHFRLLIAQRFERFRLRDAREYSPMPPRRILSRRHAAMPLIDVYRHYGAGDAEADEPICSPPPALPPRAAISSRHWRILAGRYEKHHAHGRAQPPDARWPETSREIRFHAMGSPRSHACAFHYRRSGRDALRHGSMKRPAARSASATARRAGLFISHFELLFKIYAHQPVSAVSIMPVSR